MSQPMAKQPKLEASQPSSLFVSHSQHPTFDTLPDEIKLMIYRHFRRLYNRYLQPVADHPESWKPEWLCRLLLVNKEICRAVIGVHFEETTFSIRDVQMLCHFHEIIPSSSHRIRNIAFCWNFKLNNARVKQLSPYTGLARLELWTRNDTRDAKDRFEVAKDGNLTLRKLVGHRLFESVFKAFPRLGVFIKQEMLSAKQPRPPPAQQYFLGKRVEYVPDVSRVRVWRVLKEKSKSTMVLVKDFELNRATRDTDEVILMRAE